MQPNILFFLIAVATMQGILQVRGTLLQDSVSSSALDIVEMSSTAGNGSLDDIMHELHLDTRWVAKRTLQERDNFPTKDVPFPIAFDFRGTQQSGWY